MASPYQIGRRTALFSMVVSAILASVKITVGWRAHSTAVVADGVESAGDVLASGLIVLALWWSSRPPDEEHPYGHGRLETLIGQAVGVLLTAMGTILCVRAADRLHHPAEVPLAFAIWPLIGSVLIKAFLFLAKLRVGRRLNSAALIADAANDAADILSGLTALVAIVLAIVYPARFPRADEYGGIAVGVIVVLLGLRVIHDTALQLMDTMPDSATMAQIRAAAVSVPGALGVEKCFARKTGLQYHVDLHLEVDERLTVKDSHAIATQVRLNIKKSLPWVADVLVHVEPHTHEPVS